MIESFNLQIIAIRRVNIFYFDCDLFQFTQKRYQTSFFVIFFVQTYIDLLKLPEVEFDFILLIEQIL